MKTIFGSLFIRCTTNHYKVRVYRSTRNRNAIFVVRTLSQMQFS